MPKPKPDITTMPFGDAVQLLAKEQGRTVQHVIHSGTYPAPGSPSPAALRKAISGEREPTVHQMEEIAGALGVPPQMFIHYRLAKARDSLDPRVVGLRQATAALKRIEIGLLAAPAARQRRANSGQQQPDTSPPIREAGRAPRRKRANDGPGPA